MDPRYSMGFRGSGQAVRINPGRTDILKGHTGSPPFRQVCSFKNTGTDIGSGAVKSRAVWGRCGPRKPGFLRLHASAPSFQRNNMKLKAVKPQEMLDPAGVFPDRQAIACGQRIHADIGRKTRIQDRSLNQLASQGIDPVENYDRFSGTAAGCHGKGQGIQKSIEAGADILHVKTENVKGIQHFFRQFPGFSV